MINQFEILDKIMETKFATKIQNLPIITREDYSAKLQRLIQLETDHSIQKAKSDYKLAEKFDVLELDVEGIKVQKLIKKGTNLRFVSKEVNVLFTIVVLNLFKQKDMFSVINRVHEKELGHSGRTKMYERLSQTYANITKDIISAYLALCETCQLKKPAARKGIVVKPIISSALNSRSQV